MEEKVKAWIKRQYEEASRPIDPSSVMAKYQKLCIDNALTRSYGVLMFAINELFDEFNDDLGKWWDNEMLPKFRELQMR